ncbi:MAG: hypothetical protein QM652_09390 [Legionella sp.]|uniref:hypothetical protein n=1 Tax=Legionella sp. TaxID=459 RepID=UPI0039E37169
MMQKKLEEKFTPRPDYLNTLEEARKHISKQDELIPSVRFLRQNVLKKIIETHENENTKLVNQLAELNKDLSKYLALPQKEHTEQYKIIHTRVLKDAIEKLTTVNWVLFILHIKMATLYLSYISHQSNFKKKEIPPLASIAHKYIDTAEYLLNKHYSDFLSTPEGDEVEEYKNTIPLLRKGIYQFCPSSGSNYPLQEILTQAKKKNNADEIYQLIEEFLSSNKTLNYNDILLLLQYQVTAYHQSFTKIFQNSFKISEFEYCINIIKNINRISPKILDILTGANLNFADYQANMTQEVGTLNAIINQLDEYCRFLINKKDCQKAELWTNEFANTLMLMKRLIPYSSEMKNEVEKAEIALSQYLKNINEYKEEINRKRLVEIEMEQEKTKAMEEFVKQVEENLNFFKEEKKRNKRNKNCFYTEKKWKHNDDRQTEDEELLGPHIVSAEKLASTELAQPHSRITILKPSLHMHNGNNDLTNLKNNFAQADYHRLQAFQYVKNHQINEKISHFKQCIKFLSLIIKETDKNLTQLTSGKKRTKILEIHDWAKSILQEIHTQLQTILKNQHDKEERLIKSGKLAKKDITQKHGFKAWFKEEDFSWEKLSKEAKTLIIVKNNIRMLNQFLPTVEDVMKQVKIDAPYQVSPLPTPIVNAFEVLQDLSGKCYLMGSAVRSLLADNSSNYHDLDFLILSEDPEEVALELKARNFFRCPYNSQLFTKNTNAIPIDCYIVNFRTLKEYVEYSGGFTFYHIYCQEDGCIVDPSGEGLKDNEQNILNIQNNALTWFQNDATRLLRTINHIVIDYKKPSKEVDAAIKEWQPTASIKISHIKAVLRKYLNRYSLEQQINYVEKLQQYTLLSKLFNLSPSLLMPKSALTYLQKWVNIPSNNNIHSVVHPEAEHSSYPLFFKPGHSKPDLGEYLNTSDLAYHG